MMAEIDAGGNELAIFDITSHSDLNRNLNFVTATSGALTACRDFKAYSGMNKSLTKGLNVQKANRKQSGGQAGWEAIGSYP